MNIFKELEKKYYENLEIKKNEIEIFKNFDLKEYVEFTKDFFNNNEKYFKLVDVNNLEEFSLEQPLSWNYFEKGIDQDNTNVHEATQQIFNIIMNFEKEKNKLSFSRADSDHYINTSAMSTVGQDNSFILKDLIEKLFKLLENLSLTITVNDEEVLLNIPVDFASILDAAKDLLKQAKNFEGTQNEQAKINDLKTDVAAFIKHAEENNISEDTFIITVKDIFSKAYLLIPDWVKVVTLGVASNVVSGILIK